MIETVCDVTMMYCKEQYMESVTKDRIHLLNTSCTVTIRNLVVNGHKHETKLENLFGYYHCEPHNFVVCH